VDELRVGTHRNELSPKRREIPLLLCQSSKLGCSDKGKISRIKEEHGPLLARLYFCQADLAEIALRRIIRLDPEIRYRVADLDAIVLAHLSSPLSVDYF